MLRLVPALGWMHVDAPLGTRHLGLPSDLFLLTVYCSDGLLCGEADEPRGLEVVVTAMRTRPAEFRSLGRGTLALAQLTPLGVMQILRTPLSGLIDRRVPLEHFVGRPEQQRLRGKLMSLHDPAERSLAFGRWLESRALERRSLSTSETRAASAIQALRRTGGRVPSVLELATDLRITRRQLERDFNRHLGIGPVSYARLVRFQRAAMALAGGRSILEAALTCGFADQSHLTRVFGELSSVTPRALRVDAMQPGRAAARRALAGRVLILAAPHAELRSACTDIETDSAFDAV